MGMCQEVNAVVASHDTLVDLVQSINTMVEFISVLALATKQVMEGRLSGSCPH